jgi:hypothetical protein
LTAAPRRNGKGIDSMLDRAKDRNGYPFEAMNRQDNVRNAAVSLGRPRFACRTQRSFKVTPDVASIEPGVTEVAPLQAQEGFTHLHP